MSPKEEMLEVVDEKDVVMGQESREKIHQGGLLHREIHIWFFTPRKEIIFQHRATDKDTYPDLLDATVGGHVEPGDSYEHTAVKECKEETGLDVSLEDLVFLRNLRMIEEDFVTNKVNNTIRKQYAYLFSGDIADLWVESGKAIGFEKYPLEQVLSLSEEEKQKFIPGRISPEVLEMLREAVVKLGLE
jgi:8-oxo-dGTP pyrophosphatase MutT (NUDIX family)